MTHYAEVIGHPIAHSKSPLIHNFWLTQLGLVGDYRASDVKPQDLERYFAERAADTDWRGCNITIPHKIAALDFVSDPGDVRNSIVLFALAQADIGEVVLVARNALKAAGLLAHFGLKGKVIGLDARLPDAALLVNASPLGMVGQEALEIDLSPLPEHAIVYDLVYAPIETALLKAARMRDLETVDGLEMLVGQAAIAFELFFGVAPPDDGEDALRALLLT